MLIHDHMLYLVGFMLSNSLIGIKKPLTNYALNNTISRLKLIRK